MTDRRADYLAWHTAGTPATAPPDVVALLDKFVTTPLPFVLNANAASSPMMVPGVHPMAYRARLGLTADADRDRLSEWVALSTGAPSQAGYRPMDWNHATVDHLLVAWVINENNGALVEAANATDALHALPVTHTENQRAFGHMLEVDAKMYAATGLWKYAQHAGSILAHLHPQLGFGPIDKGGWPYVNLNSKGLNQADHGNCQVTPWMTSRILHALRLWASLVPGAMGNKDFRDVAGQAFQVVRTAVSLLANGPPEGHVADYDPPSGKIHDYKDSGAPDGKAMWIWTMVSLLGLWDAHAKLIWEARDSMRPTDSNADRLHDLSCAIAASAHYGWRAA